MNSAERQNMVNGIALITPAGRFSEFVPSPRIVADFRSIVGIRKPFCAQLFQNTARLRAAGVVIPAKQGHTAGITGGNTLQDL